MEKPALTPPRLPQKLKFPLTFGIFAPSGAADDARLRQGIANLENRGHRVIVAAETYNQWRYFAGTDDERLAAFHRLLATPEIDVMIMARGGYGWSRLLHRIDWQGVAESNKVFLGYSDFTAFNLGALARSGIATFVGPGAGIEFAALDNSASTDDLHFMEQHFWPIILGEAFRAGPFPSPHSYPLQTIEGPLWGSNLSLLTHLVGTPYFPYGVNGILFLEEIDEQPYAVERMFFQLFHAGVLQQQRAILLGHFTNCAPTTERYPYSMDEVLETVRELAPCPVLSGLPFGHVPRKLTLPFGVTCSLEIGTDAFSLVIPERR